MAGRGGRDLGKERFWRRVLRRWQRSGQTVRSYCLEHGLSEPCFYAWRRTIQERNRQATRSSRPCLSPAGRVGVAGVSPGDHSDGRPTFVPVSVEAPAPALEVVLREGCVVRVPAGFEPATLRQLLAVLAEAPPC